VVSRKLTPAVFVKTKLSPGAFLATDKSFLANTGTTVTLRFEILPFETALAARR